MKPDNAGTGLVIGQFGLGVVDSADPDQEPEVIPLAGTVTFTPNVPYLPNPTALPNPITIVTSAITAVLDSEGYVCTPGPDGSPFYRGIRLFATDDPDLSVENWTWSVVYTFEPVNGTVPKLPAHSMPLLEGETVDLATVVPVPASPGIGTPQALALLQQAIDAAGTVAGAEVLMQRAEDAADRAEAPTDSMMASTASNPASQFSGVLDDVIEAKAPDAIQQVMGSVVYGMVADSIAADPTVANAAAAAVDANPKIELLDSRTKPISPAEDDSLRVRDSSGRVAWEITPKGQSIFGDVAHEASDGGYRIRDKDGRVAFEIDEDGKTRIHDLVGGGLAPDAVTTLHVFVCSGQSNMQGRGFPIEGPQTPRIMQFGATRRILEQAPLQLDMVPGTAAGTSPALFFAEHYLATQPDHVGVLLIPAAMGGTKFTWTETSDDYTWTNGTAINPEHGLYERSVQQALDGIAAARTAGYHVITKGVLWHQGEGNGGVATSTYAQALDTLISDYRADLGHSTLPVMIGQQCPEGMEDNPAKYTVDAAHQDTPYRTSFTGFAPSTRNGHNVGDTTHFSTVGTKHLGDTYNTAYIQALGNTRPIGA